MTDNESSFIHSSFYSEDTYHLHNIKKLSFLKTEVKGSALYELWI